MEATPANMLPFAGEAANLEAEAWITAYTQDVLAAKDEATIEAYTRILKRFAEWLSARPGNHDRFHPQAISRTAIEFFLDTLPSSSYKKQARAALSWFCRWLQEDHQLLLRNPVRGVSIPAQALFAPRELSGDQRYVIRDLMEREADLRGKAVFALGRLRRLPCKRCLLAAAQCSPCEPQGRMDDRWAYGWQGTNHRPGE